MDDPGVDAATLAGALGELVLVNGALGGYGPSLEGVERLLRPQGAGPPPRGFSILDVGCGSGDTLRRIVDWARQRGLSVRATGVEISAAGVMAGRRACAAYPEITIEERNLFDMDASREPFDIVHAAMMLHHMRGDGDVRGALAAMSRLAIRGVVINDLHRHAFARLAILILTRLMSRNPLIRHDAPLSVARGFSGRELQRAAQAVNANWYTLSWRWPFRWLLVIPKPRAGAGDAE